MGILNSIQQALGVNNQARQETGSFDDYRVACTPESARPGDTVHIDYRGLLKNAGATEIYLHYAFDSWNSSVQTVKMARQETESFQSDIRADGSREINFCFKDSAGNWDNNNGWNWTLHLQ